MARLQIAPTKTNLLAMKEQLVIAQDGYELLEQKREILVMELMQMVERVKLLEADIRGEDPLAGRRFDLLVSNPPYIPEGEVQRLEPEVRDFEPPEALNGGADGLAYFRCLAARASGLLRPGGWMLVEVGAGQAGAVAGLFEDRGLAGLRFAQDYAGIERVVSARVP